MKCDILQILMILNAIFYSYFGILHQTLKVDTENVF